MAGLGFDNFFPGKISSRTHGIIDYIHAGTNIVAGLLLMKRSKAAGIGAMALGGSVLMNALMTDYEYGVFRKWSFKTHGLLDYGVAATSAALPALFDIDDTAAKSFFYAQGGGETTIAGLTNYDDDSGAEKMQEQDWDRSWAA